MSPFMIPISWPFVTLSPSFTFISNSVFSSRRLNTRINTSSPHIIPSCLHISSTSPGHASGITALVVISSLVISSARACCIRWSAFNFIVIWFILLLPLPFQFLFLRFLHIISEVLLFLRSSLRLLF